MKKSSGYHSSLFLYMNIAFAACLLLSNLVAGKLISVFGVALPAAVILFPVTYILGDIFTEVYGFKASRRVIWSGFACCIFAALVYMAVVALPYPGYWTDQSAYAVVLGTTPRILAASLAGYLFGEFLNAIVLSRMKVATKGRQLWGRTLLSSVVGVAFDTVIFINVAFLGTYSADVIWKLVLFQYIWKLCYEAALTPLIVFVIKKIKKFEGVDVFDHDVKYSPFN